MGWKIDNKKCMHCGGCVSVCPFAALDLKECVVRDEKLCTLCGTCEKACPVGAITVKK